MCKLIEKEGDSIRINAWLATATFFVLIVTLFSSVVALTVTAQNHIDSNRDKISVTEAMIKENQDCIESNENRIIVIETRYVHIMEALERIEQKVE